MARFVLTQQVTMRELSTADVLTAMIASRSVAPRQVVAARAAVHGRGSRRSAIADLAAVDHPHLVVRRAARVLTLVPLAASPAVDTLSALTRRS
jgi:phage FluMu protein gp41